MSLEFWLGNEKLHYLLSQGTNEMRMDMKDFTNEKRYVKYSSFNVGNEFTNYTVTLSGFSGDVDDCFTGTAMPINNMMFTTRDQDNDMLAENCADLSASGWWHNNCVCANPNGLYLSGETALHGQQQCVWECRHRPKLCRGVNYRKQEPLCELVSAITETEPTSDYVRIELGQETVNSECLSCSIDELCVMLSCQKFHSIKEGNAVTSPKDCTDIYNSNTQSPSGHYQVLLPIFGHVTVFCDMATDGGGLTIVFQRRHDGSEDFNRTWIEYKNGFGNVSSEFWLGNDKIHHLLAQGTYEMRMDMKDFSNEEHHVKYSSFYVGNEFTNYTVTLSGFSGDVGNVIPIDTMMFTTSDQDNDVAGDNCAELYVSGWWHKHCNCANPNGLYLSGETAIYGKGITYKPWLGAFYSLRFTELKVRRVV
uniref:Ficolin-1 n=1 Tax=Magallana gigas TaxID=29159 RepID=K1QUP3_MAGGI